MKTGLAIAKRREQLGLSQEELAKKVGVSKASISRWESGDISNMRRDRISKLAEALRVSPLSLLEEETEGLKDSAMAMYAHFRAVPVYETVAAGFGAHASDEIVDWMPCRIASEREAEETIGIIVRGDSMEPKIESGDVVQVHRQDMVDSGDIAVILIDGEEGVVKKIVFGDGFVELVSLNPAYPPRRFDGEEMNRLRIVGRVKSVIRPI